MCIDIVEIWFANGQISSFFFYFLCLCVCVCVCGGGGGGAVGGDGVMYLTSLGLPTDIGLQLDKECYPCSR